MPFTLENWNSLISNVLHATSPGLDLLTVDSVQNFIKQSKAEHDKVRTQFLEGILERPKVKDKQQYVKLNQAMLIRLLDKLYSLKQKKDADGLVSQLYNTISRHLEDMLDFIEDFFGNYFDRDEKVPKSYLIVSIQELCRQLELLKKAIEPNHDSVHAIGDILVNKFNNFCTEKNNGATYNELIYQKELMNQLLIDNTLASENTIKEVLFYFNYNDDNYIAYLYEKLNALTQSLNSKKEKIAALRYEQKNFNQLPTRPNYHLSPNMPPLKDQVNHWIEEEVKYLEINHSSLIEHSSDSDKGEMYVHVPFKGPEIYLLHKSFLDSGGATGETYKSLFEKTGSHISNKNQRGFSKESLQKSSDKVDYEAKENIKRFLQKMIRNIDSY